MEKDEDSVRFSVVGVNASCFSSRPVKNAVPLIKKSYNAEQTEEEKRVGTS